MTHISLRKVEMTRQKMIERKLSLDKRIEMERSFRTRNDALEREFSMMRKAIEHVNE